MRNIWTEENKFKAYLEVEILAAEAWSELGVVPKEDVAKLRANATFNVDRIHEIEEVTRHDVVAFTRTVSESLGEERKWVHYGLTSTDVVDTANGYLLKQANTILRDDLQQFVQVLKKRANEFKYTPVCTPTSPLSVSNGRCGILRCSAISNASKWPPRASRPANCQVP